MVSGSPSPEVRYADVPAVPWANGAGTTVELVSLDASPRLWPTESRWRLSIASLERTAPFSPLPGVHRQFMPVGGDVVLTIGGVRTSVARGEVCEFDGREEVELVELPIPCNAVNLMIEAHPGTAGAAARDGNAGVGDLLRLQSIAAGGVAPAGAALAVVLEPARDYDRFDLIRVPSAFASGRARSHLAVLVA